MIPILERLRAAWNVVDASSILHDYMNSPAPEKVPRLEQAIRIYGQALQFYSKPAFSRKWALIEYNLGLIYKLLPNGDRGANLICAIGHYYQALRILTESTYPNDWANTHNCLGNAYAALPSGDGDTNVKYAIGHYEQALRVLTQSSFPWN